MTTEPKIRSETKYSEISKDASQNIENKPHEEIIEQKSETFETSTNSLEQEIKNKLSQEHKILLEQLYAENKERYEEIKIEPIIIQPHAKEIIMTDAVCKALVANIDEIGEKLGKDIQKSVELASQWNELIKSTDIYIKSLKNLPWKRLLTWSACLLTLGGFLWKMGIMRAIPEFAGSFFNIIPKITPNTINSVKDIPKPSATNIVETLATTPLTPIGIVTGVGTLTVLLGVLKGTVWVLRKLK